MINKKKYIINNINKQKKILRLLFKNQEYDKVLLLIGWIAAFLYNSNSCYYDRDYEKLIHDVSKKMDINPYKKTNEYISDHDTIVFYDMFGFDERGLAYIYLNALLKFKKVIYVTKDNAIGKQPKLLKMLNGFNAVVEYIKWDSVKVFDRVEQVSSIIQKYKPSSFFFYSWPWDVEGNLIMHAYEGYLNRYLINLTDHAYWLGADCCDVSIEFRNFGYWVSNKYRNIDPDRLSIITYYPIVDKSIKNIDLPSICKRKKFFFSGGSLYKTISKDNKYYVLVDRILTENKDLVFWYAGNGDDSQIKKLMLKFGNRVVFTNEVCNLYQVINKSEFYLSTYPLVGGLMFQYAALAGKIPLTLKSNVIANDFIKDHESLGFEFETIDEVCKEVKKILNDKNYASSKREKLIKSVPTEQEFDENLYNLVEKDIKIPASSDKYKNYDFDTYHKWYLEKFDKKQLDYLCVGKNTFPYCLFYFPIKSLKYFFNKIIFTKKQDD